MEAPLPPVMSILGEGLVFSVLDQALVCVRLLFDALCVRAFRALGAGRRTRAKVPQFGRQNELLQKSASELAKRIRSREIRSEQLVLACIERIAEVQPHLKAVVCERFSAALEDARRVDRIVASLAPSTSLEAVAAAQPFLGVPFSTKEGIRVQTMKHSYGVPNRASHVSACDADAVRLLRESGAIPLCVTNVSELGMWWESANAVYGTTSNPYNKNTTPGGSSGGEAALQTTAAIPISLGSDSGGSLRTPAAFCGLFAHKPTPGLVSVRGANTVDPPPNYVSSLQCLGPLCRCADDLVPIFKVILGEKADKLKLDQQVLLTRLRYFYLDCAVGSPLLVSPVSPEVRQAMLRVVDFIEDNFGVTVEPVRLDGLRRAVPMFMRALEKDGYGPTFCQCLNDCQGSCVVSLEWLRWLTGRGRHIFPCLVIATMERIAQVVQTVKSFFGRKSQQKQNDVDAAIEKLKKDFQTLLGDDGVLLCPPHPTTAPLHRLSYTRPFNFVYAAIFNVAGLPATSVPLGLSADGLPLGVQVVAGSMNDHLSLAVAKSLERPFGGWTPPFTDQQMLYY